MDLGTKRSNNPKDGFGIVLDGLIEQNVSLLIHNVHLYDFLMVVKSDKNW
jgi:hypothetical protein